MTNLNITESRGRILTAFFDTRAAAEKAVRDLTAAGIAQANVKLLGEGNASSATGDSKGFWESLKDFFIPDEDRYAYAEGLRRGGFLVSVQSDAANYNRAVEILDRDGSIDMDEREASWRAEGWTGYQGGATGPGGIGMGTASYAAATEVSSRTTSATGPAGLNPKMQTGENEVISLYEERITIGKRDVNHGRVRLRSYVVETPVTEQVTLHSEHVEIDRRPIDRVVSASDAAFKDRVLEAEEHAEEAVVQKDVRVKEEISLRKVAEDRTQTVSDKVRRTEVEIEDKRDTVSRKSGAATKGTPTNRIPKV